MKLSFISLSIISLALIVGCAQDKEFRTGLIVSQATIAAGVKAPQIIYQDPSGSFHQLFKRFGEKYTLVVFMDKKTGNAENTALVRTASALFKRQEPATIVEIIGGDSGCNPADRAYVLKRNVPDANLITLCDLSGKTWKHFGASHTTSVYLVDPSGVVMNAAPFSRLDTLLDQTRLLAKELAYQQVEFCND
jgi:hypothetical protein